MSPGNVVHAMPTKDFFISMITRDISLTDCILDLLDNAVDGARAQAAKKGLAESQLYTPSLAGYRVNVHFDETSFSIVDNCGGISLNDAVDYAFHFGRRRDASTTDHGIGLYGIGLKRAMFKIGRTITVDSTSGPDSFRVLVDVPVWAASDDWDFQLEPLDSFTPHGTHIRIRDLNDGVAAEFGDKAFTTDLLTVIGRDYAIFLEAGLVVLVNDTPVKPMELGFLQSSAFAPFVYAYRDGNVDVEIVAGISRVPADSDDPGEPEKPETRLYGWFVTCNDRVVLAGNKDERTVWGDERFPRWHPQFNGFVGIVHFRASDPRALPWTTTKRDVDAASPLFQRARTHMREATRAYIDYTNIRKERIEEARLLELEAKPAAVDAKPDVGKQAMRLPQFDALRVRTTGISYRVPLDDFEAVRKAMGNPLLTRPQVGIRTFEYYKSRMAEG